MPGAAEPLEVGARLAEPLADALDLADREALADERVQVDAARDDVSSAPPRPSRRARRAPRPRRASGRVRARARSRRCRARRSSGRLRGRARRRPSPGRRARPRPRRRRRPRAPRPRRQFACVSVGSASATARRRPARSGSRSRRRRSARRRRAGSTAIPGGEPNATDADAPERRTASHGPGQLNVGRLAIGTRPSPRPPSQLRQTVHGCGWSAGGAGTSAGLELEDRGQTGDGRARRRRRRSPAGGGALRTRV